MKTAQENKSIVPDTREYIVSTARELFSDFTYLGVSMEDIAQKLHISKAALYYHFSSKNEIYEKVMEKVLEDLKIVIVNASNEKTTDKKLDALIQNYLNFGFKEKNVIKALVLNSADDSVNRQVTKTKNQIIGLIEPIIAEVNLKRKMAKDVDNHLSSVLITAMMDGLIIEYSFAKKKINSAKVANQIIAVLLPVKNN
jgi:AcrR family transcriptional regulator